MVAGVELTYNTSASALAMANTIFGNGATVNSASYTGWSESSAVYSNADAVSDFVVPGDSGVIFSTGRASQFTNNASQSNLSAGRSTNTPGPSNQADFNAIAGRSTFDASYLDVNFTPTGDTLTMQFVFSSDEYPEYSNSVYNDVFGVWINGTIVPISVTNSSAAVTQINQTDNINLYNDNTADQYNTEMDGFTVTMTLTIPVNAGVSNSIRIGVADTSDASFDTNVLIAADSVQSDLIAIQDDYTMQEGATRVLDLLANDDNNTTGTLTITHLNGIAVSAGDSVTLATGQVVVLNADGTVSLTTDSDNDTISFTYEVLSEDSTGLDLENDVGFVTITTIPCFVAGSRIATPDGPVRVEQLQPGQMVLTKDDGPQPLRWIGRRVVKAEGAFAPVSIAAGAFGDHGALLVSPQHRILIRDAVAELFFGEAEVLVAAKSLVDNRKVCVRPGGDVEYVHLLFDAHQVVICEGLETESFLPGPQIGSLFEQDTLDEICAIFPELDPQTGGGYSPAARRTLRQFEARVLTAA